MVAQVETRHVLTINKGMKVFVWVLLTYVYEHELTPMV